MKRVSEENNIVLYVLLLNKINLELEQDNLQLYFETLRKEIDLPFDIDKEDIQMMIIAFENKRFSFRIGLNANNLLDNYQAEYIMNTCIPYFQQKQFSEGLHAVFNKLKEFYFPIPIFKFIFVIFIWILIFGLVGFLYFKHKNSIKTWAYWQFTLEERNKLDFITNFFVKVKDNKNLLDTHYLICFKPIHQDNSESIVMKDDTKNDIRNQMISEQQNITVCDFKHTLHFECLDKWQKAAKSSECPICLQEISKEIVDIVDLKERLLAIQYDLMPKIASFYVIYDDD